MLKIKDRIDDEIFIDVCIKSKSMAEASSKLGLHFNSFKRRAKELNCYKPNKAGVGIAKKGSGIPLSEILEGKCPQYQTFKLKKRLVNEGLKDNSCEVCGIKDWNNTKLNMELDHIDGDRTNHNIDNLRMICPNCHSQTDTYRSKNRVPKGKSLE
jgi:5-methylcytosine-specific restriction endonuclease McrA